MFKSNKSYLGYSKFLLPVFGFVLAVVFNNFVLGFTEPTTAPPGGNVSAPLNVNISAQTKLGDLGIQSGVLNLGGNTGQAIYKLNNSGGALRFDCTDSGLGCDITPTRLVIGQDGNVGIGTTSPGYKLDVADRMRVRQGGSGTAGIWLYQTTPGDMGFVGALDDNYMGFWGGGAGFGLVMNRTSGNVGIGTTAPGVKLDVNGTVYTSGPNIEIGGSKPAGPAYAYLDLRGDDLYTDYGLRLIRNNTGPNAWSQLVHRGTNAFYITTQDPAPLSLQTSSLDRLYITSGGNVGIGTTAPLSKLSVGGIGDVNFGVYSTGSNYGFFGSGAIYDFAGNGNVFFGGTIRGATYGFGGMYRNPGVNNPFTGGFSCPSGFTDQQISSNEGGIGFHHICYK